MAQYVEFVIGPDRGLWRSSPIPSLMPTTSLGEMADSTDSHSSLAPGRDDGRAFHYGPLVLVGGNHGEAVGFAAFPGGAVAVLVELPDARAPRTAIAGGDTPNLAISRECHLELYSGRRRCGELCPIEECRLNFRWRELGGGSRGARGKNGADDNPRNP